MIATCVACGKRYRLPDEAVPPEGRSVRCTACGHGWTAYREGFAAEAVTIPPGVDRSVTAPAAQAASTAPAGAVTSLPFGDSAPAAAARAPVIADEAMSSGGAAAAVAATSASPAFADPASAATTSGDTFVPPPPAEDFADDPPGRRPFRWGCLLAALLTLLALGALAVVEFAPVRTFNPPRLGLPPIILPMADLGSLSLPKLALPKLHVAPLNLPALDLPPLDLTRIPVVGDRLDALVNPPPVPASPLRLSATGERSLAHGHTLLTVAATLTNPTAQTLPVGAIEATLADPAGHVAFRWRIAPPVTVIDPHQTIGFDAVAANYPPDATVLRLRLKTP